MKRVLLTVVLGVGCGAVLGVGCGAPQSGLSPHQPARVVGAVDRGALERDQKIDFVVGLAPRDPEGLERLVAAQAHGLERAITPAQFAERFGVSQDDYQRVLDWAQANHLEVVRTVDGRSTVTLRGEAAEVERAFGTHIDRWSDDRGSFFAPTAAWSAPLDGLVAGVVGLDDASRWFSQRHDPGPASPDAGGGPRTPGDLRALYHFPTPPGALGEGETIGILGTGFAPSTAPCPASGACTSDVPGWALSPKGGASTGVPINTFQQYTQVFVGGPNRDPDALASNEYSENLLDVDMALGLAPAASVVHVFTATNSPGLFSDGITFFINQVPQAHAVSVSFGTCERVALGEVAVLDNLFLQAKSQGQQWFFASGDNGTDACRDGAPNKVISVNWPSSSPYVMSVGGTQCAGSCLPGSETVWGGAGAGGGGQSEIIAKPAYQMGVGPYPNDGVRDQPDVAALAGPPGAAVFAQGSAFSLEGTSAASPMWAAVWAVLDQQVKSGLGIFDAHECIYQHLAGSGFHDITAGNNSDGVTPGYAGLPGYDLATGWGTPDVRALILDWKAKCP